MPRAARQGSESGVYHVVARGASHQIIFETDDDRTFFMSRASLYATDAGGEIYAWCLMDNHVHFLLRMERYALSGFMHILLGSYAGYFNRVHGRTGALFEGRFSSEPVDSSEYLMVVVRYIHRNPLKAGVSKELSYPWSSYNEYACNNSGWASTQFVLDVFEGIDSFIRFHADTCGEENCLDIPSSSSRLLSDADAIRKANTVLGEGVIDTVRSMSRSERNAAIVALKREMLSVRQIQRLTGVSLGTISKAGK